jgi:hypothetical protein
VNWKSDPLWAAIAAMQIVPDGAVSTFTVRLAWEHGWSAAHAESVTDEYRRFLYLAARTNDALTPSDDVDQAWHLHLLHSRHYWDILCAGILRRPLHHDPTGGGAAEAMRHQRQYGTTLARYRAVFGEDPAPAIWPADDAHFAARPLRIDAARYWLVPRMLTGRAAAVAGSTALIAACSALAANATAGSDVTPAAGIVAGIALIAILVLVAWLLIKGGGAGGGGGASCTASCGVGGGGDSSGSHGGHGCGGHGCGSGCGAGH